MFGNGTVSKKNPGLIMKTEEFIATSNKTVTDEQCTIAAASVGWKSLFTGPDGKTYGKVNPKFYDPYGNSMGSTAGSGISTSFAKGEHYFCSYDLIVDAGVIEVSANSFPGTLTDRAPMWGNTNQFSELLEAA